MSNAKVPAAPSGFDLSINHREIVAKREDKGTVVHLRDELGNPMYYVENGERKPVTWTVVGSYSNLYRRALDTRAENRGSGPRTRAMIERSGVELVVDCSLGWDGIFNGTQKVPFDKDLAIAALERAPWLLRQVDDAMTSHELFFVPTSTS